MHATDDLTRVSGLTVAHAAAQSQGSGARASRIDASAVPTTAIRYVEVDMTGAVGGGGSTAAPGSPAIVPIRLNLADAFGPALADRAVARGGKAMVFRGDGTVEAV